MIFDGNKQALQIEETLGLVGGVMKVVLDEKNESGKKYVEMKKRVGGRLGVRMDVVDMPEILKWNEDPEVTGIMIQLPYPNSFQLIGMIDPNKDVDGLREDSPYKPATVRAVLEILKLSNPQSDGMTIVVGSRGQVGRRLIKELPEALGMNKDDFDPEKLKQADVVISCTGEAGLIKPEMVKEGVVCIDVGFPKGDFDPQVVSKASFFTPVPGGVGPVTVAMLFKNLLDRKESVLVDDGGLPKAK